MLLLLQRLSMLLRVKGHLSTCDLLYVCVCVCMWMVWKITLPIPCDTMACCVLHVFFIALQNHSEFYFIVVEFALRNATFSFSVFIFLLWLSLSSISLSLSFCIPLDGKMHSFFSFVCEQKTLMRTSCGTYAWCSEHRVVSRQKCTYYSYAACALWMNNNKFVENIVQLEIRL